ncbi:MAG: Hsp70 family protein [Desulfobacterales bacterium]|nr:Hsp70 family protein [Desulfobacteraceae bacterium]MBT4363013.1 Hsp70 family protein [Desulfobacteraceae bacterium]MBT7085526.1 Hsp70 family protein [Desulfobacterales bacterium]MBT7698046.1 Hsp70 family protein [Desulfobacterales bacterium]
MGLGTTNSCVSIMKDGMPKIITNSEIGCTTPSIVAVSQTIYGHSYPENDFNTSGKYDT